MSMLRDLLRYWWNPSTYNAGTLLHRIRFRMTVEERRYFHHYTFQETAIESYFRKQKEEQVGVEGAADA